MAVWKTQTSYRVTVIPWCLTNGHYNIFHSWEIWSYELHRVHDEDPLRSMVKVPTNKTTLIQGILCQTSLEQENST
jgi:hypothetical protein